jgi:hypothetical protein
VIAHHARAARVIDGRTVRARVIEQLVVALHARSRQVLFDDVFGERWRGEQTPQELEPADNRALIGVLGGRFSDAGRPNVWRRRHCRRPKTCTSARIEAVRARRLKCAPTGP